MKASPQNHTLNCSLDRLISVVRAMPEHFSYIDHFLWEALVVHSDSKSEVGRRRMNSHPFVKSFSVIFMPSVSLS